MESFCCSRQKAAPDQLTPTTTDVSDDCPEGLLRVIGSISDNSTSSEDQKRDCVRLSSLFSEVFVYESESSTSSLLEESDETMTPGMTRESPRPVEPPAAVIRRRKRRRTFTELPVSSLELSKPVEIYSDEAVFADRVSLVPWLMEEGVGVLASNAESDERSRAQWGRLHDWARQTAVVLDSDSFNEETTNTMMREIEEKINRRSYFQLSVQQASLPSSRSNQTCSKRFMHKLKSAILYLWSVSARERNKMSIEVLRLRPHGKMLLGEMRWTRLLDGIRVWAFFGFSALSKIDCHIFYLDQTTGCFKLARLPNDAKDVSGQRFYAGQYQTLGTNRGQFTSSDFVPGRNADEASNPAPKFGRNFPLDTLFQIDRSRRLSSTVLADPALASMNLAMAAAMWSNNTLEPLVCASGNPNDIDDLITVIRFLQFYNGMNPAQIIDDINTGR